MDATGVFTHSWRCDFSSILVVASLFDCSETYSILVIPFAIGFYQQVYSTLPALALKQFGKKVIN